MDEDIHSINECILNKIMSRGKLKNKDKTDSDIYLVSIIDIIEAIEPYLYTIRENLDIKKSVAVLYVAPNNIKAVCEYSYEDINKYFEFAVGFTRNPFRDVIEIMSSTEFSSNSSHTYNVSELFKSYVDKYFSVHRIITKKYNSTIGSKDIKLKSSNKGVI